jgi:magnesium transporter
VIVDYAVYRDGERSDRGRMSLDRVADSREKESFVWLNLAEADPHELEAVGSEFGLSELAVEDAQHAQQRPKIERYEDMLFVVLRTAYHDASTHGITLGEIHLFIGPDYVIVVRHGGDPLDLEQIRQRAERKPELMKLGPSAVLYAVMDEVVDDYGPVVETLSSEIEHVEGDVFSDEVVDVTHRIYSLKREVLEVRRATAPLVVPLERVHQGDYREIHAEIRPYFRDIHDHLQRANDQIESFRELLTGILEANIALVSVRQNDIVQKISGWAAILAVPTLISGVYGMNFQHMPELNWAAGYPYALGLMLVLSASLYALLRRIGWL